MATKTKRKLIHLPILYFATTTGFNEDLNGSKLRVYFRSFGVLNRDPDLGSFILQNNSDMYPGIDPESDSEYNGFKRLFNELSRISYQEIDSPIPLKFIVEKVTKLFTEDEFKVIKNVINNPWLYENSYNEVERTTAVIRPELSDFPVAVFGKNAFAYSTKPQYRQLANLLHHVSYDKNLD
tara:strand:- start:529 stop:1071 length:543 start_codon:yes stop_codon:yes gene_type:complete